MKSIITILAAIAILFAAPAMSLAGGKAKGPHGKVTSVDSQSITISNKKSGETKTFKIDDSTKVSVDGQDGKKASDITVGMRAKITPGTNADTAGSIVATSKGKGKKSKATT